MLAPVPPRERLATLDVLRGFALCGVMIGNMVLYSGRWTEHGPAPHTTLDEIAEWFLFIAVDSKAQTLLCMLFGFGFAIQLLRAEERGEPVLGVYVRRLAALAVLGWLHVTLLWWGDVVWTYAVAGIGLLPFMRASNRARVAWGIALIFVPYLAVHVADLGRHAMEVFVSPAEFGAATARMGEVIRRPDRAGLAWEHAHYALVWVAQIYVWYFLWCLGRFLLGYVAGAKHWFDRDGADHLPVFRRLALWGGAVAVLTTGFGVLNALVLHVRPEALALRLAFVVIDQVRLLATTFAYIGIVVLLMQRALWRRVLGVLAPAGRMPLTTYFTQSVVCTFIFYGWGLGWAGHVGTAGCIGLAVAIFSVQVALAHLWLHYFRFGPLEWLWRAVVYLRVP